MANPHLATGEHAPAFTLPAQDGGKVRLTEYRGYWIVLHFHPQHLALARNELLLGFDRASREFEREDAIVLQVSGTPHAAQKEFAAQEQMVSPLLYDKDNQLAMKFGVCRSTRNNGQSSFRVVRTTLVIDPAGTIVRIYDAVRKRGHIERVRSFLHKQRGSDRRCS